MTVFLLLISWWSWRPGGSGSRGSVFWVLLLLLLLLESGDDALALHLDLLREARVPLLDEPRRKPQLEERHREGRGQIVQVRAHLRELDRLYRLIEELVHRFVQLLVEQRGHF